MNIKRDVLGLWRRDIELKVEEIEKKRRKERDGNEQCHLKCTELCREVQKTTVRRQKWSAFI